MKVLLLFGGNSDEREVSIRSAESVREALVKLGHQVIDYDTAQGYDELDSVKPDVALPILHGRGGEDGEVQAELQKRGIKFLGADSKVSKLCFDKGLFRDFCNKNQILVAKGEVVNETSFTGSNLAKTPFVLKPIDGGSSVDTFIIRNADKSKIPSSVWSKHPQMLIEELIEGIEVTVPILDNEALPVIEIIPPAGEEFDYQNKYNGKTQELCPANNVSLELQNKVKSIALSLHKKIGCRHLSRIDFIIRPDGEAYCLEINTIPGLTSQSLYPKAANVSGISFENLVDKFIEMALDN